MLGQDFVAPIPRTYPPAAKWLRQNITYPRRPETRGPLILALGNEYGFLGEHVLQTLAASSNATIVHPTYQFSDRWRYPISVHVQKNLAVFDWIGRHMQDNDHEAQDGDLRRVGVCGDFLAGSLAISLALTESHPSRPHVSAAAVTDPVLDWTDVFPVGRSMTVEDITPVGQLEAAPPSTQGSDDESRRKLDRLLQERREIFRKAEDFFDPFVSPSLFFRTPYFDLPPPPNPLLQHEADMEDLPDGDKANIERKRVYPRIFPPQHSGSVLPPIKIITGDDFVLRHQSSELLAYIRKSLDRAARTSSSAQKTNIGSRSVSQHVSSIGAWDQRLTAELGEWLGTTLRER